MRIYGDGWYTEKNDAEMALDGVVAMGANAIGLVESAGGVWGILYGSEEEIFPNHRIDGDNPLSQATIRRLKPEAVQALQEWKDSRDGAGWREPQWRRTE